jgi:hypothetical protein
LKRADGQDGKVGAHIANKDVFFFLNTIFLTWSCHSGDCLSGAGSSTYSAKKHYEEAITTFATRQQERGY